MNGEVGSKEGEKSLRVEPKLVTVDGVDGAGSSVIAKALAERLRQAGYEVLLIEAPKELQGYPKRVLENYSKQDSSRVNLGYLAETKRAYRDRVRPALTAGMVVIMVSSEVKNLMHAILDHNEQSSLDSISKGTATNGLVAGTRVVVQAPPEEIVKVLQERKSSGRLSQHDPTPQLIAVNDRVGALRKATDLVQKALPGSAVIKINNDRLQAPDKIAADIISRLKLSSN